MFLSTYFSLLAIWAIYLVVISVQARVLHMPRTVRNWHLYYVFMLIVVVAVSVSGERASKVSVTSVNIVFLLTYLVSSVGLDAWRRRDIPHVWSGFMQIAVLALCYLSWSLSQEHTTASARSTNIAALVCLVVCVVYDLSRNWWLERWRLCCRVLERAVKHSVAGFVCSGLIMHLITL